MNQAAAEKDLIVLAADADISCAMQALLSRSESLGIAPIDFDVVRHHNRDPGCRTQAANYLRPHLGRYARSLVIFDRDGCSSNRFRVDVQNQVELDLRRNGWKDRSKAIVIDPELEAWVWGFQEALLVLGWSGSYGSLRSWLGEQDLWPASAQKPPDPKKALDAVMRRTRRWRSPRIYEKIASAANLAHCQDAAFCELKDTLQLWFPSQQEALLGG